MPYVKLTDDGADRVTVADVTFDEDNRVQEVSDDLADHLVENFPGFEHAEESDAEAEADDDGDTPPEDAEDTGTGTIETEDVTAEERETDYDGVSTEEVGEDGEPAAAQGDADTGGQQDAQAEDQADADAEDADADTGDKATADDADEAATSDAPMDPGEYTIDELDEELAPGDYSDDDLDALYEAESDGQDREGAKDAIDSERSA